jgi:hypothetical protein
MVSSFSIVHAVPVSSETTLLTVRLDSRCFMYVLPVPYLGLTVNVGDSGLDHVEICFDVFEPVVHVVDRLEEDVVLLDVGLFGMGFQVSAGLLELLG